MNQKNMGTTICQYLKLPLIILTLFFLNLISKAQNLIVEDTICSVETLNKPVFQNEIYPKWNFNKKKFTRINKLTQSGISDVYDIKFYFSNGKWYGFYPSYGGKNLYLSTYTSSITSIPTHKSLGTFNNALTSPIVMDIVNSQGIFYSIISNYAQDNIKIFKYSGDLDSDVSEIKFNTFSEIKRCTSIDFYSAKDSLYGIFSSYNTKEISIYRFDKAFSTEPVLIKKLLTTNVSPWGGDIQFHNNKLWIANGSLNGYYSLKAIETDKYKEVYNQEFNLNLSNTSNCHLYFGENSMGIVSVSGKSIFLAEIDTTINKVVSYRPLPIAENGTFSSVRGIEFIKEGGIDYMIANDNSISYIYKIEEPKNNWKQVEYTAFNSSTNTFVSKTDSVYLYPKLTANYSIDNKCLENKQVLTATIDPSLINSSTYRWKSSEFDITSSSKTLQTSFKSTGEKSIKLTVTDLCKRKDSITTTVNIRSNGDITSKISPPNNLCTYSNSEFINTSSALQDSIIVSNWLLIKNATKDTIHKDSNFKTSYIFDTDSTYTLFLNNISKAGCSANTSLIINPTKGPKADFTFQNTCMEDTLIIRDNSLDNTITTRTWHIDNETKNNDSIISFKNDSLINRVCKLITKNSVGCETEIEKTIKITPLPSNDFDSTYLCNKQNKQILNRSNIVDFTPLTYQWFVKDSLISTDINPIINFKNTSEINLTLISTSINQCKNSISKKIKVIPSPLINFTASNACLGKEINLVDKTTDPQYPITQRKWLVNQAILNGTNPKYIFASPGDYPIVLEVTNSLGCSTSLEKQISVFNVPKSVFTNSKVCDGKSISFYNNSTSDLKDPIKTARWFYDSKTLLGDTVNFTYLSSASNLVQLNVETQNGCLASSSTRIISSPSPISSFELSTDFGAPTLNIQTNNKSKNAISYQWIDNINGNLSTLNSPSLSFDNYGSYELSLIATSSNGCTDTSKKIITVTDPNSSFTINDFKDIHKDNIVLFNLNVNNTGNRTLDSLQFEIDFGGQFTQLFWIKNISVSANSNATIRLPISVFENNFETYDYICIKPIETNGQDTSLCILKGENLSGVSLFPNPAKDIVNISYYNPKVQEIELELFNIQGESLLTQNIYQSIAGKQSISINLVDYTKGIYILILKSEDENLIYKIEKNQ